MITVTEYSVGIADYGRRVALTLNEETYLLEPMAAIDLCDELGDAGTTAHENGDDA